MGAKDTIIALSSGKGKSAISVIRLSGSGSCALVGSCLAPATSFGKLAAKAVGLFTFVDPQSKRLIDHVTAVKYHSPHSFTGENMVELFCHGSEIVVEKILTVLVRLGAVYAERGEFTQRAYWNGKFDLLSAEAILGIVESRSEQQLASSVDAYFGGSRRILQAWKNAISDVLRDTEAAIEFPEEGDVVLKGMQEKEDRIDRIIKEIEKDIVIKEMAKIIEKGINVPIVGIPNAGKSSLFNLLLECDRSIVHWKEGTTRDSISEEIMIGGEKIRLVDTAGLRKTRNQVEMLGIGKTEALIRMSAMIIWVTPADTRITLYEKKMVMSGVKSRLVCIISKEDQSSAGSKRTFCENENIPFVSSCLLDTKRREDIVSFISEQIETRMGGLEIPSVIRNQRQETVVNNLLQDLKEAQSSRRSGDDIFARFLRKALDDIGEIIGETTSDEIIKSIFSEFCIGK
jgi:tRNA modification GTPase